MPIELVVPKLGESITEAVISRWLKRIGERAAVDEAVVELETDKVTLALPAPAAGVLVEQRQPEGATVRVGETLGLLDPEAAPSAAKEAPAAAPATAAPATAAPPTAPAAAPVRAEAPPKSAPAAASPTGGARESRALVRRPSPALRRALREHGTIRELAVVPAAPAPTTAVRGEEVEEVVPMSPLRRRIAERLVEAQHSAAILTTFNEVDMTNVMALRARYQEQFTARHGIKLGFMSFFVRAAVEALKAFPGLNAEVRGADLVYKKHYHIGVAVGGGRGLVVPVLRRADQLGFAEIERRIGELAQKAKANKLSLDELSGGTFTISNGGIYGSMMSTPLLNLPQTGILGMHNIVRRPMVVGEAIQIRPMMYLALSYDHRVADGREAVQFLLGIKDRIEAPERLMFDL